MFISKASENFLKSLEITFNINAEEIKKEINNNEDLKKLDNEISTLKAINKIFQK
jgi:hypothetical protein